MEIFKTESVGMLCRIQPSLVFNSMKGLIALILVLTIIVFGCILLMFRLTIATIVSGGNMDAGQTVGVSNVFKLGGYIFNPQRNELVGFDETIQLNKKENAILHTLCLQQGDIVERDLLLTDNWGDSGLIYSRSLDTYITALRKHLKKDSSVQIITVKGVGCKLVLGSSSTEI